MQVGRGWRVGIGTPDDHDTAALIWAAATAARDGDDEIASLDEARPVIDRVMRLPGAFLLKAAGENGDMAGFAAIAPLAETPGTAEVHYLGIRPDLWGRGVGAALLDAIPRSLRKRGFAASVLDVYADNERAVALYVGHGWRPDGDPGTHLRSGRLQQRYRLAI